MCGISEEGGKSGIVHLYESIGRTEEVYGHVF